jgi:hypothetical protein
MQDAENSPVRRICNLSRQVENLSYVEQKEPIPRIRLYWKKEN